MHREQVKKSSSARALYIILTLAVAATLQAPASRATEQRIDLDGNPLNGAESKVITKLLSSYPVQVENTVINNASGRSFQFVWPGAGPAGFSTSLTVGPDVGARWVWSSTQVVYSIESPITFTPTLSVPVFGQPPGGIIPAPSEPMTFIVPGKSIFPTAVTLSNASLTSSLITFFSPPTTKATCGVNCVSGQCDVFVENLSGGTATVRGRQPGCCLEPRQILCGTECYSYLQDPQNCGGCGITCGPGEICNEGVCMCPEEGQTQCGDGCFDLSSDGLNCGECDASCSPQQSCSEGDCVCPGGETACGAWCVDVGSDPWNCGACDAACNAEQTCSEGSCLCPEGETACGEWCVDSGSDPWNCGECGNTCQADQTCVGGSCVCPEGQDECDGVCVDLSTEEWHCGACGVTCGGDQFCYSGQCFCLDESLTNCGGVCLDLNNDSDNCGSCGNACGESGCCIEGECNPYCEELRESSPTTVATAFASSGGAPVRGMSPVTRVPEARQAPARPERGSVERETSRSGRQRSPAPRTGSEPVQPKAQTPRPPANLLEIEEAPLCDIAPFEGVVPDGERFEFSQTGGRYGKEVQIAVTLEANGEMIAQGPCPVVVPVLNADTTGVVLSPVKAATLDASGDAICQPAEGHCDYFLSLDNVGDSPCLDPVATLSSAPDEVNTEEVTFLNATSAYPDWAPWPGGGLPPDRQTNLTAFSIAAPEGQGANTGRNFQLTVTCANLPESIVTPFVLGIGGSCNPATDLDGESYDLVDGLRFPVNAQLVLEGAPINQAPWHFHKPWPIPLEIRIGCGALLLGEDDIEPNPEIIALVHETLGPQSLDLIKGHHPWDNPQHPFFRCDVFGFDFRFDDDLSLPTPGIESRGPSVGTALSGEGTGLFRDPLPECEYALHTRQLPKGNYVISIRMPDGRVFQAGFKLRQSDDSDD